MKILRSLKSFFGMLPECKSHTTKQDSYQEQALRILVAKGEITLAEIRGNHPAKLLQEMRKAGYVMGLKAPGGERWAVNPKTKGRYKVYRWSGKVPANWVTGEIYTGRERCAKIRGA